MAAADRKVELVLPENLLEKVDSIAEKENMTRSEYMENAVRYYIEERERRELREQMISGYQEMADINLKISEEFYAAEQELWFAN